MTLDDFNVASLTEEEMCKIDGGSDLGETIIAIGVVILIIGMCL